MYIHAKKKRWKGKLEKVQKSSKEVRKMLQISLGMEERERKKKKKFQGVIPKGWGIGMLSRPASHFRELRYGPCSASGKGHKMESVI